MEFKNWFEAVVSSANLLEAMQKTLEMRVDGEWEFGYPKEFTKPESVKITGKLRNSKTHGASYFFLSAYALKERPGFVYDSLEGGEDLRITASFLYIDGKGGYSSLGQRMTDYPSDSPKSNYGQPLKSPFWLADWVNHIVSGFEGFGDGGDEPEVSPEPSPSQLVGV